MLMHTAHIYLLAGSVDVTAAIEKLKDKLPAVSVLISYVDSISHVKPHYESKSTGLALLEAALDCYE